MTAAGCSLTVDDVPALLSSLPVCADDCDPAAYADWVRGDIMPHIDCYALGPSGIHTGLLPPSSSSPSASSKKAENVLAAVIRWCMRRARSVERADGRPHRALKVASIVEGTTLSAMYNARQRQTPRATSAGHTALHSALSAPSSLVRAMCSAGLSFSLFGHLRTLRSRLHELCHLHDAHPALSDAKLSLEQYESEINVNGTPQNITLALLDRCTDAREIPRCIREHVRPCSAFLRLDLDAVLVQYASELAQHMSEELKEEPTRGDRRAGSATATTTSATKTTNNNRSMLRRCLAVVPHISSTSLRCSAALSILRHAVPPYEPELIALADRAERWALRAGGNGGSSVSHHVGIRAGVGEGGGIEGDEGGSRERGLATGSDVLGGLVLEAGIIDIDGSMRGSSAARGGMLQSAMGGVVAAGGSSSSNINGNHQSSNNNHVSVLLSEIREHQSLMRLSEIQARHYKQKKTSSGWSASTNSLDLADPEHAALLMRRCCSDVDDTGGGRGV